MFVHRHEDEEQSKLLEQLYVHGVYEKIALDFEQEQHQPYPDVKDFLLGLPVGSLVADIGDTVVDIGDILSQVVAVIDFTHLKVNAGIGNTH